MILNNAGRDGKAQASSNANTFSGKSGVKDFIQMLLRNACSSVGDGDSYLMIHEGCGDSDLSFALDRLTGINKQVHENLV